MKKNNVTLLLAAAVFLGFSLIFFIYTFYFVDEFQYISIHATATNGSVAGFNTDVDSLKFGTVPLGGASYRKITISHQKNYPVNVIIKVEGNITPYFAIRPNAFTLGQNSSRQVEAITTFPSDAAQGNYSGTLTVKITKNI